MGLEDPDLLDDGGRFVLSISCSICLEDVTDCGDRAFAKLQCGHQFHLDCIGSAFNAKGVMQCPNCRKIEKGQWLYADGCRPFPELNIDDLVNHDDAYDLTYPESSMWCPFGEFSRFAAAAAVAIDEVEFPTTGYDEIVGQHADFSDQSVTVTSATRICPFIAYVHPSISSANVGDGGRYNNNRWNNSQSEIPNSHSFPTMDVHYNTHVDHPRMPMRTNIDMPTAGSYLHSYLPGQSSSTRGPSSISSVTNHPHPDSGARAWERSQALEAYFQQPNARIGHRSNHQVHMGSSSDPTHGIYYPSSSRSFHDADNSMLNPFHHISEGEPPPQFPHRYPYPHETGPFHQPRGGSARQHHGSARVPSHRNFSVKFIENRWGVWSKNSYIRLC